MPASTKNTSAAIPNTISGVTSVIVTSASNGTRTPGSHVARRVQPLGQPPLGVGELRDLLLDLEDVEKLAVDGSGDRLVGE